MTYLISFSNKISGFLLFLGLWGMLSPAWGEGEPSRINAPLKVRAPQAQPAGPLALGAEGIEWSVEASGGVGSLTYGFVREFAGERHRVQTGPASTWRWTPQEAGVHRVQVIVSDEEGNSAESAWSEPFEIAPPLEVKTPQPTKPGPQIAPSLLVWTVEAAGGVGRKNYTFDIRRDGEAVEQVYSGPLARWTWRPELPGAYEVRVRVRDTLGNQVESDWSEPYRIFPPLIAAKPQALPEGPQMLGTVMVEWSVESSGGVGTLVYTFTLRLPGGEERQVQSGPSPGWRWTPLEPGPHQVRVTVTDEQGNSVQSPWSDSYGIAPRLRVEVPIPDRSAPQAAQTVAISWAVDAIGGVGRKSYVFELAGEDGETKEFPTEAAAQWAWRPESAGLYRVRAAVTDGLGNRAESEWSEPYRIEPALSVSQPVAGVPAPQVVDTVDIPWTVQGLGGVGEKHFVFELRQADAEPVQVQEGAENTWRWRPDVAGRYRVRARMYDALGNQAVGPWSEVYEIAGPLVVESLEADRSSPQAAQTVDIVWTAEASGGVGEKTYVFELMPEDGIERPVQHSSEQSWTWKPQEAGRYRVRVRVYDALENRAQSNWSSPFEISPALAIREFQSQPDQEEFLVNSMIAWNAETYGGVGKGSFQFLLQKKGTEPVVVHKSSSPHWDWQPTDPGEYRVRIAFLDSLGNRVESNWTSWFEVVGPLSLEGFEADRPSPQPALRQPIRWTATTRGGVGETVYEFRTLKDGVVVAEQVGTDPVWSWQPRKTGTYQVQVAARDTEGHAVESEWSPPYFISPALERDALIAFLPVENLSGAAAPLEEIEQSFSELMVNKGFRFLDQEKLSSFMAKYRWRNTGFVSSRISQNLRNETGAEAVLITSVESYQAGESPRVSLIARLVLCADQPKIIWIESVGLTGNDNPGLLGLGLIRESELLVKRAELALLESLERYLAGEEETQRLWYQPGDDETSRKNKPDISLDERFLPRSYYRATQFEPAASYSVAVVPFLNEYARENAGFVVHLHMIEALHPYENLEVFEPGVVREYLLKYRLIMPAGPSLAISDILSSPTTVDADLVLSGQVFDYQGLEGTPKVDFSIQIFNGKKREVVWWSRSYAKGDEGVYFFDVGRIRSVQGLAERMAAAVGAMIFDGKAP